MGKKLSDIWKTGVQRPSPSDIPVGGLAIDLNNGKIFTKNNSEQILELNPTPNVENVVGLQEYMDTSLENVVKTLQSSEQIQNSSILNSMIFQ